MNHPDFKRRIRKGGNDAAPKPELLRKGVLVIIEGKKGGMFSSAKQVS